MTHKIRKKLRKEREHPYMRRAYILFLVRMGANLAHTLDANETEAEKNPKFLTVCLMDRAENLTVCIVYKR
jgi:hypothetical protein